MRTMRLPSIALGTGILLWATAAAAGPLVTSVGGSNPASIQASVDTFRSSLGALNPNVAGSFGTGRREINWDGVPDAFAAPNSFPANFFNVNSPRGAVFSTPGTGFQVSANAGLITPVEFGNIDATYPGIFSTFSPQRLFASLGSNVLDVTFFVPGSATPAFTRGFGAVFTDVDLANTTSLQFFGVDGSLLFTEFVLPGTIASESLSFLGVSFTEGNVVSRVRITSGNSALGLTETSGRDLVVLDDFIYGEPNPVPSPPAPTVPIPTLSEWGQIGMLALLVLGGFLALRRRSGLAPRQT
jgi:IPTL-CTERM motif